MSRLIEKLGVRKLAIVPFFLVLNTISTYSFSLLAKRPNWLYVRKVRDTSRRKENRMTADRKSMHTYDDRVGRRAAAPPSPLPLPEGSIKGRWRAAVGGEEAIAGDLA